MHIMGVASLAHHRPAQSLAMSDSEEELTLRDVEGQGGGEKVYLVREQVNGRRVGRGKEGEGGRRAQMLHKTSRREIKCVMANSKGCG